MKLHEIWPDEPKFGEVIFEVDEHIVHVYYETSDPIKKQIAEAKHRGEIELGGQYSANKHSAHIPGGQIHLHIYAGQAQIASLNDDGTGHDGYSGRRLPNKVAKAIRSKFPDFNVPDNNILEALEKSERKLLAEKFRLQ